jgi:hypothetical protein
VIEDVIVHGHEVVTHAGSVTVASGTKQRQRVYRRDALTDQM